MPIIPSNIVIHGYGFGMSAGQSRSASTPGILKNFMEDFLLEQKVISSWQTTDVPEHQPQLESEERTDGVKHVPQVKEAVTNLAKDIAETQLKKQIPVTVGGDHSQAFSTIKATMLTEVAKAIGAGKIRLRENVDSEWDSQHISEFVEGLKDAQNWAIQPEGVKTLLGEIDGLVTKGVMDPDELQAVLENIVVICFDAHTDMNNSITSDSGNFHGMAMAAAAGHHVADIENEFSSHLKIPVGNLNWLAPRDIDEKELQAMIDLGMKPKRYDMSVLRANGEVDPDKISLKQAVDEIRAENSGKKFIYSLDVDGMDAEFVPGTGTPVGTGSERNSEKGPSLDDAYMAFVYCALRDDTLAVDVTEGSPGIGRMGEAQSDNAETLYSTATLLGAAIGVQADILGNFLRNNRSKLVDAADAANQKENALFANRVTRPENHQLSAQR